MGAELALAFSAGMVATVNPCGFAMLPAYLSYYLGLDENGEATTETAGDAAPSGQAHAPNPVIRALAVSASVTLGFLVVFGIMGFAWTSVSELVGRRLPYFTGVIGIGLIGLGIAMLRGFQPVLRLPKLNLSGQGRQLSSMFLYGVSYAIASLSCTITIFIGIVSTTLRNTSFAAGVSTFLAYGLGMGMTLSILTIAVALAKGGIVRSFRRVLPYVDRISGGLLILAGAFVSYYAAIEIRELNSGGSSAVVQRSRDFQGAMQRWVESVGGARLAVGVTIFIAAALLISFVVRAGHQQRDLDGSDVPEPDATGPNTTSSDGPTASDSAAS
ncbi:MAG TPA: cytochrome c biogenesis protein CcdA [Microthrixaceae bacterium]|nr:cytochrome c biogenesis protein CcdA [Microthrixaceae bacterium]